MSYMIRLTEAQNHRCGYCGHRMIHYPVALHQTAPRNALTKDHVEPRSYGGTTEEHNLIAACVQCNNLRGNLDAHAFFNLLQRKFRRDPTLRERWHHISREELRELKHDCLRINEARLRGLGSRHLVYFVRYYMLILSNYHHSST